MVMYHVDAILGFRFNILGTAPKKALVLQKNYCEEGP